MRMDALVSPTTTQVALLALTDPNGPQELATFHRWYDQVQIPAFLTYLAGTKRAVRYKASAVRPEPALAATQEYLAVYELEFDGPDGITQYIRRQIEARKEGLIGYHSPGGKSLNPDTSS